MSESITPREQEIRERYPVAANPYGRMAIRDLLRLLDAERAKVPRCGYCGAVREPSDHYRPCPLADEGKVRAERSPDGHRLINRDDVSALPKKERAIVKGWK